MALEAALRQPTRAESVAKLIEAARREDWRAPLERIAAGGDLPTLQRELEASRVRWAIGLFLRGDPLGVDVPIAFTVAQVNEVRNLRLLGECCRRSVGGCGPSATDRPVGRTMGRLTALTTTELEPGYRLAGVSTRAIGSVGEASKSPSGAPRQRWRGRHCRRSRALLHRARCSATAPDRLAQLAARRRTTGRRRGARRSRAACAAPADPLGGGRLRDHV